MHTYLYVADSRFSYCKLSVVTIYQYLEGFFTGTVAIIRLSSSSAREATLVNMEK